MKSIKKSTTKSLTVEQSILLAKKLRQQGHFAQAENHYRQALQLAPINPNLYNLLGNVLKEQWRLTEAVQCYEQALYLEPNYAAAFNNLGAASLDQGEINKALECYRSALRLEPNFLHYQSLLLGLHYADNLTAEQIFQEHLGLQRFFPPPRNPAIKAIKPSQPIRIGYVSGDFREHSVNYFFEPILKQHNREQFHITCYNNHPRPDAITQRLKKLSNQWVECFELNDQALATRIRRVQIDILVDLSGLTPLHRLGVFALKPAPVQITGIGYVHTSGLSTMGYRLVDRWTDPETTAQQYMIEKTLYLSNSYCCYHPLVSLPPLLPLPALERGYITFASFGKLSKISSTTFQLWCEILRQIPQSRLNLYNASFRDAATVEMWLSHFEKAGIERKRLIFSSLPSTQAVLNMHQQVDIILDTFPYNGCTTTCQALVMGVPVITLVGETHAARVGLSFLSNVGLEELISYNSNNYINNCIALVDNLPYLNQLHYRIREQMLASALMNASVYTRTLESLYQQLL